MARIAIAGFMHETNCFVPDPTDYEDFATPPDRPNLLRDEEMLAEFEEKVGEIVEAGGEGLSNPSSLKSDLLAIPPVGATQRLTVRSGGRRTQRKLRHVPGLRILPHNKDAL